MWFSETVSSLGDGHKRLLRCNGSTSPRRRCAVDVLALVQLPGNAALDACSLGFLLASIRPRSKRWVLPVTKGVHLHDLRHPAAVLRRTNGVHFVQVAKWLGHSSYVLTSTTSADYIPDVEAENPLPEPVAAVPKTNVVPLCPAARRAES